MQPPQAVPLMSREGSEVGTTSSSPSAAARATEAADSAHRSGSSASAASAEWGFPNRATPAGSSAYYAVRMSKAPQRDVLAALFALRAELQAIPDQVSDPGIARIKLDWWRGEVDRLFAGEPRHPLSEVLAPVVTEQALPQSLFNELIEAVERILRADRHPSLQAQRQSDEQDLGALFELIARCEGAHAEATAQAQAQAQAPAQAKGQLPTVRRTGGWCAQVRRIRDAGLLLRRGREVLPSDQLAAAGLSHEQLASAAGRQRLPELLRPIAASLRVTAPDQADAKSEAEPAIAAGHGQSQSVRGAASPTLSQLVGASVAPKMGPTLTGLTPAIRVQLGLHQALLNVLECSGFDVVD
jgi:phytoene synthase